jgi:hypothetical protein
MIKTEDKTDNQEYWAWRRQASEFGDALRYLQWQFELDLSRGNRRVGRIPIKARLQMLKNLLDTKKVLCTHVCKGMYFCERKTGHKGRHSCSDGHLRWPTNQGFYP